MVIQNKKVSSRKEFIEFVDSLYCDLKDNLEKWGSKDLEAFLEALGAYASDTR